MSNLESANINIVLSSTFWKDAPKAKVFIDDNLIFNDSVTGVQNIEWTGDLTEGDHKLIIELHSKDIHQTVVEDDKIVKDQLLNIDEILFDEINIGYLKHTHSKYYPDKTQYGDNVPKVVNNCVNLGLNGRWELEFTTPVYIWLLENI